MIFSIFAQPYHVLTWFNKNQKYTRSSCFSHAKVIKPDTKQHNACEGYNRAKFEKPRVNSIQERANIQTCVKSASMLIISLESKWKSKQVVKSLNIVW